jgi:hypothetical protein
MLVILTWSELWKMFLKSDLKIIPISPIIGLHEMAASPADAEYRCI